MMNRLTNVQPKNTSLRHLNQEPEKKIVNSKFNKEMLITGLALAILGAASLYTGYCFYQNLPIPFSQNFNYFSNEASSTELTRMISQAQTPFRHTSPVVQLKGQEASAITPSNCEMTASSLKKAQHVTLYDLKEMSEEQRRQTLIRFNLGHVSDLLRNETFASADAKWLKSCNLQLILDNNPSVLKYFIATDEEFSEITILDLISQKIPDTIIYKRLSEIKQDKIPNPKDLFQMSLGEFASLSGKQLNELIENAESYENNGHQSKIIPSRILSLINDKQFSDLNLKNLDRIQLARLFFTFDEEVNNKRLASIDISSLLHHLAPQLKRKITGEQIAKLDTKVLTSVDLWDIFGYTGLPPEEIKKRLAFLKIPEDPNDQREFLDKISYRIGRLLSDEQIKSLNVNIINTQDFYKIFNYGNNFEENKRRFSLFKIPEEPKERRAFLDKLDDELWKLLSEEQVKSLNINELSQSDVDKMFVLATNQEELISLLKRFSSIKFPEDPSELNAFLSKLSDVHLIIFFDEIVKHCKLESLEQVYNSKGLSDFYNLMYNHKNQNQWFFNSLIASGVFIYAGYLYIARKWHLN